MQPTALVNELYVRLLGDHVAECRNREHFFALAANTMRRILVDHARARMAVKRGGGAPSLPGREAEAAPDQGAAVISLDEALTAPLVDELSVWAFRSAVQGVKYNFNAYPVLGDATLRK